MLRCGHHEPDQHQGRQRLAVGWQGCDKNQSAAGNPRGPGADTGDGADFSASGGAGITVQVWPNYRKPPTQSQLSRRFGQMTCDGQPNMTNIVNALLESSAFEQERLRLSGGECVGNFMAHRYSCSAAGSIYGSNELSLSSNLTSLLDRGKLL